MLDKFLEDYINNLYRNSNINMQPEQMNLYKKSDYYNLLKPVITLLKENKDLTLEELREKLFQMSGIIEKARNFIYEKEMAPGLVFTYGTNNYRETVVIENRQEVTLSEDGKLIPSVSKMTEDTIFDLASVTKIYTSLSIFKLVSLGLINLDDEAKKYAPQFKKLNGVTIFDLLTFKVPLKTSMRIDAKDNIQDAKEILFDMQVDDSIVFNKRPYTDMGCLVLKYVIEGASLMSYYDFITKYILSKLEMKDTLVGVSGFKLDRTASTIGGARYYKDGNFSIDTLSRLGVSHDPKSRVLGNELGDLTGHAGLFSTASDMSKLAHGIINNIVIDDKYLEEMVKNKTGRKYIEDGREKYIQYLGSLCYSKHPRQSDSELFHAMSGRSFGSGGFVGTQFTVDPVNELFFFMGANRVHNRLVDLPKEREDEIITLENGKRILKLPNGEYITDASRFAWDRDDEIVHPSLKLAIQYKMLEDFYKLTNEKINHQENTRTI